MTVTCESRLHIWTYDAVPEEKTKRGKVTRQAHPACVQVCYSYGRGETHDPAQLRVMAARLIAAAKWLEGQS